jgi:hypothetical protein
MRLESLQWHFKAPSSLNLKKLVLSRQQQKAKLPQLLHLKRVEK